MCKIDDLAAIYRITEDYVAAFNASDVSALAALFTDNAVWLPNNGSLVVGRETISAWFQTFFQQFSGREASVVDEGEVVGDWGFSRGAFTTTLTPKAGGESVTVNGKFLGVYKRRGDGAWKISHCIWTGDNLVV